MKLHADLIEGVNAVTSFDATSVSVNGITYRQSIIVPWQGEVRIWAIPHFDALVSADFERLAELNPELVIFGSGARLRFPPPAILRPLTERRMGIETMDTAAACRTYNVLVGEGRRAIAALLLTPPTE